MFYVTRLIEPWTDDKPESCTRKFKKIHYTAKCTTCGHQCTLTFNNLSVSLYAENEKLADALSLLCERLAKEDKDALVGILHHTFDVRGD